MLVLIGDVAANYSQARASQARLSLARTSARSHRETASLTRTRFEGGAGSRAEVANAEALAAITEADIPLFEIERTDAAHRLATLLGIQPGHIENQLSHAAPIPRSKLPMPVGIPAETLLARPDVRLAERRLAQQTARIGVAEAARYPSISLTGNLATQALSLSDLAEKSTIAWAVGPAVSIPIFPSGQLRAAVEIERARRDQSFAAYQQAIFVAIEDVETSIVALTQQRNRSATLASAVSSYQTARNAAQVEYEAGASDYLALLDSQRELYRAQAALIDSQLGLVHGYISLNKALGGGWNGVVETSIPLVIDGETGPRVRPRAEPALAARR